MKFFRRCALDVDCVGICERMATTSDALGEAAEQALPSPANVYYKRCSLSDCHK